MAGRIGLFGGSFDPPHNGHIHVIVSLMEAYHLDEVLVVPAQLNPLKPPVASPEHRLRMSHLAFDPVPSCTVLDVEMGRRSPSYTIDTLLWLMDHHKGFSEAERFLLLGADVVASLSEWKEISRVFSLARPLIAARGACDLKAPREVQEGWTQTGLMDISSTAVRSRLGEGLYVDHLVPERVMGYIRQNKIYM